MNVQASLQPLEIGSLWQKTAPPAPANPSLVENTTADVTIIGAGFTGLRAALYLAEAGSRVVVLDAGDVAYGASGRTGGQVNPMLPFNTPKQLQGLLGDTYFERLTETALGSADELFDLIKTYQIECQARQNGWLRVMHNDRALTQATEGVNAWNAHGAGMEILGREDIFKLSGSRAYASGVVTPKGGAVQPMSLAQGVADAARQRGVKIHGRSAVTDLEQAGDKWIATTDGGRVTSDWVVVATNGYTDSLIPGLAKSVLPLTPIQMATDPLPEDVIGSVLPGGHTISDSRRVIMYARREPDNRMVYGGFGKVAKDGTATGFDWLIKDANRVFPQLKGVDWTSRWWGRVALTDDHLPHLHEPKKGLLVGMGYNGRGVAMSHVMGRVLAERVLGAAPETLAFPTSPVRAFPYRSVTMAGMGTAVWFMRFLDFIESKGR
ncbi:MAG: FAD-binding oxidoreductase [Paracoccaceae bacterium]